MALYEKLYENFSSPLSADKWQLGANSANIVVTGGSARIHKDAGNELSPQDFAADGTPIALFSPAGVFSGEIEGQVKFTPVFGYTAGQNYPSVFLNIRSSQLTGTPREVSVSFWSENGEGSATTYGAQLEFSDVGSGETEMGPLIGGLVLNKPFWAKLYLNRATGLVKWWSSPDGITWTERYSGVHTSARSDGYSRVTVDTALVNKTTQYVLADDYYMRTSDAILRPDTGLVLPDSENISTSVQHYLDTQNAVAPSKSSSPLLSEGGPRIPVTAYGFGGGFGAITGFGTSAYGSVSRAVLASSTLEVSSAFSEAISNNILLKQIHNLGTNSSRSVTAFTNILLEQAHELLVDNTTSNWSVQNIDLLQQHMLALENMRSLSYMDNISLSTAAQLGIANAASQSYAAIVNLIQQHTLSADNSRSLASSVDISLIQELTLLLNSSRAITYLDNIKLTEDYKLLPGGARSNSYVTALILEQIHTIAVASGRSLTASQLVDILQYTLLGKPSNGRSYSTADVISLIQQSFLEVDNANSRTKLPEVTIVDWDKLSVDFGLYKPTTGTSGQEFAQGGFSDGLYKPTGLRPEELTRIEIDSDGILKPTGPSSGKY